MVGTGDVFGFFIGDWADCFGTEEMFVELRLKKYFGFMKFE